MYGRVKGWTIRFCNTAVLFIGAAGCIGRLGGLEVGRGEQVVNTTLGENLTRGREGERSQLRMDCVDEFKRGEGSVGVRTLVVGILLVTLRDALCTWE